MLGAPSKTPNEIRVSGIGGYCRLLARYNEEYILTLVKRLASSGCLILKNRVGGYTEWDQIHNYEERI